MRSISGLTLVALLGMSRVAAAQNAITVTSLQGYGSFETAGVTITFSGDANSNASFQLTVQGPSDGTPRPIHPPARFDATHAATSIFGLTPDTDYAVTLTTTDPDGVTGGAQTTTVHTRPELTLPTPTREFYVSPTGSDANAGDAQHPFASVQHGVDQLQPGDALHLAAGVYRESVDISTSGTAAHPIEILGDPGAILDGADPALEAGTATWSGSGPIYSAPLAADARYVAIDGTRLWHQEDATQCPLPVAATHDPGDWCVSGGQLYVALASGSPAGHSIQASALGTGIVVDGASFIWIQGVEIRFYGAGDYGKGIYLHGASDCVVASSVLHNNPVNLWLKEGDRDVFQDNTVFDTGISNWPWIDVKFHDEESAGISVTDDVGQGTVIRRNHVSGTFDGIDFCGTSAATTTTENDVDDNLIDDHLDDGSEADGSCINARMFRNTFQQTHMGISLAPASPGPLFILRNVIWRYGARDPGDVSVPFKFNNGYSQVTTNVFAYHNTAVADDVVQNINTDDQPGLWLGTPGFAQGVVFRNNIFLGSAYALEAADQTTVQVDLDHDDLFTTDSTRYVRWWDGSAVQHYADIASFAAATGEEAHGIAALPTFVGLATGDLRPAAGSPVIDQGVLIPGIDDDFAGSAPDLGAFELGAPTSTSSTSGSTTSSGGSSGSTGASGTTTSSGGTTGATGSTGSSSGSASSSTGGGTVGGTGSAGASSGTSGSASSGCSCGSRDGAMLAPLLLALLALRRRRVL